MGRNRTTTKPSRRVMRAAIAILSSERLQHDSISQAPQMLDAGGLIGSPFRVESMLERLERQRDIGPRQREAGEMFQRLFRQAHLDPMKAADMMREVRSAGAHDGSGVERARDRVNDAMQAMGGHGSPAGSCAWYVLGDEVSLAEWARREGWGGTPLRPETAKRILIGALDVLAANFGL